MDYQEDVTKSSMGQEKVSEKDIEKLTPLNISGPGETKDGIQSVNNKLSLETLKDVVPSIRDYISGYISLADAKAGILIGIFSGLLSVGIAKRPELFGIPIQQWRGPQYLTLSSWILFAVAIACALLVVW